MVVAKISELLKYKRQENGLTQAAVAKKLHVSRQAVSNWETGRHLPDVILIKKLANIYGITTDELISGGDKEKVEKSNSTATLLYPLLLLVTLITSRLTIASNSRALLIMDGLILLSIMLVFLTKFADSKIQILMRIFSLTVFLSCTFINDILNNFSFQTTTFINSLILLWQLFSTYYYQKRSS
ncbi:helix-turn-helix transcriptional regulator [Lactobacillus sp. UCMA15818]|uniref:helix-turn-helix transcriptional regulator n=1 Tax=Lactobacillus sp. UCMA15818 TaxID=2583394 RepID=UPI0025AF61B3|nr:helix-turn-helix transcriptional regulator [Lactobacillus sp. UCMA15818]MDN2453716.1 helix-turn-helix transcriptional regulator [Lactobacillus sp. UCMA15818]